MKKSSAAQKELIQISTIKDLASVFEGIASMQIAKIKDQVVASQQFFTELWQIYSQLRGDPDFLAGQTKVNPKHTNRHLFVVITSEGGLSGDVDQKIVDWVITQFNPSDTDLMVMGAHGANLFSQRHIPITKVFKLPEHDEAIAIGPIATELPNYAQASAFYQTYVSLAVQEVARIDLISAVKVLGAEAAAGEEVISSHNYDFEPSIEEVISYMESVMLGIALGQVMLESKLAQSASRFNAMSAAGRKAQDLEDDLKIAFRRGKRAESDEGAKEVINAMRHR